MFETKDADFFFALIVKWMIYKNNVMVSIAKIFNLRNLGSWHEKLTAATWNLETISAFLKDRRANNTCMR